MLRVLFFLLFVLLLAFGASWLADHPGTVAITFGGQEYLFSTLLGLVALLAAAAALVLVWSLARFVFQIPSLMSVATATRRRQRGYAALSRGMVAVGSGDADTARRHAAEAARTLGNEPMTLLLGAQAAQLSGDRAAAERSFTAMLEHPDTRTLALRGLYMEAVHRRDAVAALSHAEAAQKIATLPWSATVLLQARAAAGEWLEALRIVERNVGARITDRQAGNRQRAVLLTGLALDLQDRRPEEALDAARDALKLAPTLVPAAVVAGRLLGRKGDFRKASKMLEGAYAATPHPDLANVYLNARPGDSAVDRLNRAKTLAALVPEAAESRLIVGYAALDARDFPAARAALAPLVTGGQRVTRRTCLTMADVEEAENGETGALREWLQRASQGAPDPAWMADGVAADRWAPLSPVSGRLDAYRWEVPQDHALVVHEQHRTALAARREAKPALPAESAQTPSREVAAMSEPQDAGHSATPGL